MKSSYSPFNGSTDMFYINLPNLIVENN